MITRKSQGKIAKLDLSKKNSRRLIGIENSKPPTGRQEATHIAVYRGESPLLHPPTLQDYSDENGVFGDRERTRHVQSNTRPTETFTQAADPLTLEEIRYPLVGKWREEQERFQEEKEQGTNNPKPPICSRRQLSKKRVQLQARNQCRRLNRACRSRAIKTSRIPVDHRSIQDVLSLESKKKSTSNRGNADAQDPKKTGDRTSEPGTPGRLVSGRRRKR